MNISTKKVIAGFQAFFAIARKELMDVLTGLNTTGTIILEYAMQNQDVANNLVPFVPLHLRSTVGPLIPPVWWLIVQMAKARAIKKAQAS